MPVDRPNTRTRPHHGLEALQLPGGEAHQIGATERALLVELLRVEPKHHRQTLALAESVHVRLSAFP